MGVIGWLGLVAIAAQLAAVSSAQLGFDLELLLVAGRAVGAGHSPYDAALVAGSAPLATGLFYSYPPPVAQAMALVGGVPGRAMLLAWDLAAVTGLAFVADRLRAALRPDLGRGAVLIPLLAVAPLVMPFAIGLLFGNADVFFPLLYGAGALAIVSPGRRTALGAGVALAIAALKLHPASLLLWFAVRAVVEWRRGGRDIGSSARVVVTAILTLVLIGAVSLLAGGGAPWSDYLAVVRAGTSAAVVDPRNAGIAAQVALLVGGTDVLARGLHLIVGIVALLLTALAAWRVRDPLTGFAIAAALSLGTLPVTWYHYPSAMIPLALVALLRAAPETAGRVRGAVAGAAVIAVLALAWLPLLWVTVALVVGAVAISRPRPEPDRSVVA